MTAILSMHSSKCLHMALHVAFLKTIQSAGRSDIIAKALAQAQSESHQDLEQAQAHLALA
jgi:hypothetical protein